MIRQARGRIVNISSMNGTLSLPMVGAYSASKFALEALSDALRVELRPWGIPVSVVRPGQVRTDIFDKALAALAERSRQVPAELAPGYRKLFRRAKRFSERGAQRSIQPQAVARVVLRALESWMPRIHYLVGFDVKGLTLLQRLAPTRGLDRLLARIMGTMRLEKIEADDESVTPSPEGLRQFRPGTLRNS
jgi:NAD(P)-dependent dehydrogenase (short-subunit alcohol dehydrogenase family)